MCPKNISEAALFYDRFWSENDFFFSDHLHAKVAVKYLLRFDTTPPHFMLITKSSASVPQEFCVCVDKPIKSHSQLKLGWVVLRLSWFLSQADSPSVFISLYIVRGEIAPPIPAWIRNQNTYLLYRHAKTP